MKNKKLIEQNKNLLKQINDLKIENYNMRLAYKTILNEIYGVKSEKTNLTIENINLRLFKVNIKSSLKQYCLTIKEYINFYYILYRDDNLAEKVIEDFKKVLNFLESWAK